MVRQHIFSLIKYYVIAVINLLIYLRFLCIVTKKKNPHNLMVTFVYLFYKLLE